MKLLVARIRQEAENIKSFELRDPNEAELPPFAAGAYLQIEVRLNDGSLATRNYSILSDPADRSSYEIAVLFERDGRGGAHFLHERISVGDFLEVSAPANEFPLEPDAEHSILIAGGIGVTPILAMMCELAATQKSFELHYSARTPASMAYADEVRRIADERARFYFSRVAAPEMMNLENLLTEQKSATHIYVCGPAGLINAVRETAQKQGWQLNQVHFESFGARKQNADQPITVELALSGITLEVQPGKPILDAIIEAGAWAVYDCRRGECAICVTQILEGEPDHRDFCLNESQRRSAMCTCVSWAKTRRLVLEI